MNVIVLKNLKFLFCISILFSLFACGGGSDGENLEYIILQDESGSFRGEADYYNSDFIKMNTIGDGTLSIEIIPDNNNLDIDCGLTSNVGPSWFSENNFIRDDNYSQIYDNSYSSSCNLSAIFNSDRVFYLFVDIADGVITSGSYTVRYSFDTN